MSYKCDDFKPSLHGTWTAAMPREFFYCPEREHHYEPKHESCNFCCSSSCCPCEKEEEHEPEHEEEHCEHCEHHEHHKKECCCVEVESATGGAGPITSVATTATLNVVSRTVNTCCIGEANNLISFSTNVIFGAAGTVTALFQVVRTSCIGTPVAVGPTQTYIFVAGGASNQNYSFQFVDRDVPPGTYTYAVQILPGAVTSAAAVTVYFSNSNLSITTIADD